MAKLGTMQLKGASGTAYDFNVYSADANWTDGLACVYYVSKRTAKAAGGADHKHIYVGETEDMKEGTSTIINKHVSSGMAITRYQSIENPTRKRI